MEDPALQAAHASLSASTAFTDGADMKFEEDQDYRQELFQIEQCDNVVKDINGNMKKILEKVRMVESTVQRTDALMDVWLTLFGQMKEHQKTMASPMWDGPTGKLTAMSASIDSKADISEGPTGKRKAVTTGGRGRGRGRGRGKRAVRGRK